MTTVLLILQHALGRDQYGKSPTGRADYRNHFCIGGAFADFNACREAVSVGLMREYPPREISGGDYVFVVTDAGKRYVTEKSPPEPKLTPGQARYRRWLSTAADFGVNFGDWLKETT